MKAIRTEEPPPLRDQASQDTTTAPGFVWVYQYTYWDQAANSRKTSDRFATIELIRCGLGEFIPSSAKKIPVASLIDGAFAE
jgi:hypothetical protein